MLVKPVTASLPSASRQSGRLPPFMAVFLLAEVIRRRSWRFAWTTTAMAIGGLVLMMLLMLPLSYDLVRNIAGLLTGSAEGGGIGLYGRDPLDQVIQEARIAYAFPQTLDSFRAFVVLGLLLLPLFVRSPGGSRLADAVTFSVVGTAALLWGVLLMSGYTFSMFEAVPPLLLFRNPDKVAEIVIEAFVPAFALGLHGFRSWLAGTQRGRVLDSSGVLLMATVGIFLLIPNTDAHAPFNSRLTNVRDFFAAGLYPGRHAIGPVPEMFDDIANWLSARQAEDGLSRTLWLPSSRDTHSSILPVWDRNALVVEGPLAEFVLEPFVQGDSPAFPIVLAEFGVRYVVIERPPFESSRLTALYTGIPRIIPLKNGLGNAEIAGDPARFQALIEKYPEFKPVQQGEGWTIYENMAFRGMHSVYGRTYLVQTSASPLAGAPNLLRNPELADNAAGWDVAPVPNTAYRFTGARGPGGNELEVTVGVGQLWGEVAQEIPLQQGEHAVAAWVRASGATGFSFRIYFQTAAGHRIPVGDSDYIRMNVRLRPLPQEEWQQLTSVEVTPAGMRGTVDGPAWVVLTDTYDVRLLLDGTMASQMAYGAINAFFVPQAGEFSVSVDGVTRLWLLRGLSMLGLAGLLAVTVFCLRQPYVLGDAPAPDDP